MTRIPVRLGFAFVPDQPPEALPAIARAADEWLDDLWVWEDCFSQSGLASAAAALALTEKVTVGLGLMPAPLRNVALTAMEVATLHRLFPGRFVPGIGHGVQPWMDQAGVKAASPMTLLDEYATALRQLLDGEEVSVTGQYVTLDRVKLRWPPAPHSPLFIGGVGAKTLALVGRRGDGLLLGAAASTDELADAREVALATWAERTDRDGELPVVHSLVTATGPDAEARARAEVPRWGQQAEPSRYAAGGAEQIAAVIRAAADAGATTVVIQPTLDEADMPGLIRFVGDQVRGLL